MSVVTTPASTREALDMVRAGLGYLASADASQLSAQTQAECLRELEQGAAIGTAARASILSVFTATQAYADDGDHSARTWLIHQTRITRGAARWKSIPSRETLARRATSSTVGSSAIPDPPRRVDDPRSFQASSPFERSNRE